MRELYDGQPTQFECASAVTQLEALRAGVGLGVVHDYIARRFPDLERVLPERRAMRAYWIVTHEDTRGARGEFAPRTNTSSRAWSAIGGRSCERRYASSHNSPATALLSRQRS